MLSQYRMIHGYPSDSGSDTDIWEAQDIQTGKFYIFKVFVKDYTTFSNTGRKHKVVNATSELLLHEIKMYKYLRDKLIYGRNARNILCIQDNFSFTRDELAVALRFVKPQLSKETITGNIMRNFKYLVLATERRESITANIPFSRGDYVQYWKELYSRRNIKYDEVDFKYECIITPRIKNLTFLDFLNQKPISLQQFSRYIFIIFVTLYLLLSVGVNQNDIHWKNILLDDTYFGPPPYHKRDYLLVYKDRVLYIDNAYIPFIFDFDRAALKGSVVKQMVRDKAYISGGNCPKYHPKRDFLRMLCNIFSYYSHKTIFGEEERFLQELLTVHVRSEYVRKVIREAPRRKYGCMMSEDREAFSVLCVPKYLKDISEPEVLLDWILSKTDYESFPWKEVVSGVYSPQSSRVISKFVKNIPTQLPQEVQKQWIYTNVQFVEHKSEREIVHFVKYIQKCPIYKHDTGCVIT